MCASCDNKDAAREAALNAARNSTPDFGDLRAGYEAVENVTSVFSVYDENSYQTAKENCKLSKALKAEYFASAHYLGGNALLSSAKLVTVNDIGLISSNSDSQVFLVAMLVQERNKFDMLYYYKMTYSVASDVITAIELIGGTDSVF